MISAFGVDHGEISKSLKPRHLEALARASKDYAPEKWRAQMYASERLSQHGIKDVAGSPEIARRMDISRKFRKKSLTRLSRTRRPTRDRNRKPIFGDEVKS